LALDSWAFRWAVRHANRMAYFSSSAAYPVELQTRETPSDMLSEEAIDLDQPRTPDATYGLAKLTGELLAREAQGEGLPVHVFRPFSGYGWDQDLDYPFPSFIRRAHRRDDPFVVWGDGTQTRDFIHIDDVVGAVVAALDQDVRGPVNLCTGVATSFLDLAALCLRLAKSSAAVQTLPDRPVGCWRRVGDPTAMLSFYRPVVELEQGVATALSRRERGLDCR
jgi:nucleoside-diphosphate-sugar epimerase